MQHRALRRVIRAEAVGHPHRIPHQRHNGADVDNRTAPCLLHLRHGMPRHQISAFHVHIHHLVPDIFVRRIFPQVDSAADARAIQQHIQPAVGVDGSLHHRLRVRAAHHIACCCDSLTTGLADNRYRLRCGCLAYVRSHDARALSREPHRRSPANTRARARYQRNLAFQSHSNSLFSLLTSLEIRQSQNTRPLDIRSSLERHTR